MKMEEQRTKQDDIWVCEKCKTRNTSNICSCCGNLRPKKKAPNITVTTGVSSGTQRSGNSDRQTEPVMPAADRHNFRKGLIIGFAALAIVALFAGVGIICLKSTGGKDANTAPEKNDIHEIGSAVTFGAYEQDNNLTNGSEPIEWIVLDAQEGKSLLVSKYVLDCQQYSDSSLNVTWETCMLRQWLNETFLNDAFSSKEKELIPTMLISAERNPSYDRDPGKDTNDGVFLLSIKEAERYFDSNRARMCAPTAHAIAEGAALSAQTKAGESSCWWWLRSLGGNPNYAARVLSDGTNGQYGDAFKKTGGVRPAIWVDNNSDFFG